MKISKEKLTEIIKEELINEVDYERIQVPAKVKRFQQRFIDAIKNDPE